MVSAIGRCLDTDERLIGCNYITFSLFTTEDGSGNCVVQNITIRLSLNFLMGKRIQEY